MVNNKGWMSFLALAPFLGVVALIFYYFSFVMNLVRNSEELDHMTDSEGLDFVFSTIGPIVIIALIVAALSFLALIFYIIHIVRNPRLQGSSGQIAWIIAIIFISHIAVLAYWIIEILGKEPIDRGGPPRATIDS